MSEQRYVEIPGSKTHELPPLLLHVPADAATDLTSVMLEAEDMLGSTDAEQEILEQRKFDLALQLTEQYKGLSRTGPGAIACWNGSGSAKSPSNPRACCENCCIPMSGRMPAAPASSNCCARRRFPPGGVALDRAVGLRLTFRQPPPIDCFSSQFLFYLNATVADTAYHTWSQTPALFPPDRFHFDVLDVS